MIPPLMDDWRARLGGVRWGSARPLLASLGRGHLPVAVMLTCAELGGIPDQVGRANPGEILVVQNLGGVVAPLGDGRSGITVASMAYALSQPTVRYLIVCGHRRCCLGATNFGEGMAAAPLGYDRCVTQTGPDAPLATGLANSDRIVQQMILQQLCNLWTHPDIRHRAAARGILWYGWMLDEKTAIAHQFDPGTGRFRRHSPSTS